jgi:hypothetical protein
MGDARDVLERAIAVGDGKQVKLLALDDADLEPLCVFAVSRPKAGWKPALR